VGPGYVLSNVSNLTLLDFSCVEVKYYKTVPEDYSRR